MTITESLIRQLSATDELTACRKLVGKYFPTVSSAESAVDVLALARHAGIAVRSVNVDAFDGVLTWDGNGAPLITRSSLANPLRDRFTMAHELGHWLMQKELLGPILEPLFRGIAASRAEVKEEERLANMLAAEILLPFHPLSKMLAASEISMSVVKSLGRLYRVSHIALLRRIADVADADVVYLNLVPYSFSDLGSVAEIDDAFFMLGGGSLNRERERTKLCRKMSYRSVVAEATVQLELRCPGTAMSLQFEVTANSRPIPNADLLSVRPR